MADVDAICYCGKDMSIESQAEFVRLVCVCGAHKLVNITKLKGSKDTQPIPAIVKGMTEADINAARERLTSESRDGDEWSPFVEGRYGEECG